MAQPTSSTALTDRDGLLRAVSKLPRERVAHLPTALEEMPRLREALGADAPALLVKREDQTGLAFGGNKGRHLEFRLADIRKRGADTLVIQNHAVSNHARIHTALAAKYGLDSYILKIPSDKDDPVNGNLLLDHLLGAHIVESSSDDLAVLESELDEHIERLEAEGRTVYNTISDPYSTIAGTIAYLVAAVELLEQLDERGGALDHIVLSSGAAAAGLTLAGKLLGSSYRVHAVGVGDQADPAAMVCDFATRTAELLGFDITVTRDDFTAHTEYGSSGYAVADERCLEAIRLAARTEALIVDPVYTGKSFSALVDQVRNGAFDAGETVVFIHTGGTPNVFSYSDEIMASLSRQ
ncbi:MAG: pyridoxal-phosphate dependent enzyme [Chloroflexota bacterium]